MLPVSINSIFVEVMLVLQFAFSLFLFLVVLERVESALVQTFVSRVVALLSRRLVVPERIYSFAGCVVRTVTV